MLESFPATSVMMLAEGSIGLKCHKLELGDGAIPLIISSLSLPPSSFYCFHFGVNTSKQTNKKVVILPVPLKHST